MSLNKAGVCMVLAFATTSLWADDKADYNARAAARDVALFQALDRDANGELTLEESKGDLNLGPHFQDIDIDRNGIVTREELQRYIGRHYGVQGTVVPTARPAPR